MITYARKVSLEEDAVTVERGLEDCSETVKAKMPVLITVTKEINEPRTPSYMAIMNAFKKEVVTWKAADLNITSEKVGETGSAVRVLDVLAPKVEREKIVIEGETATEIAEKLAKALIQEGIITR